jgi:DNA replication protein DnaC
MKKIGEALASFLKMSSTISASDTRTCEVCKREIPALEIEVFGTKRYILPKCKCETEQFLQGRKASEEYEIKRQIEQKFSISNLGERFAGCTFDSFAFRPGTEKIVSNAKTYVEHFEDTGSEGFILWGTPGNGKSHIAAAITHGVKDKGFTVVFQTVPELLERIKSTFNNKQKESEREIMDALLHCDLLVLDDIGSEKVTDWVLEVMFRIIDGRYRKKKPIIYTSNFKPSELKDQLNERIYDRMVETSIIIENKGTSYRREIGRKRYLEG